MKAFVFLAFLLASLATASELDGGEIAGITIGSTAFVTLLVSFCLCLVCVALFVGLCCGTFVTSVIAIVLGFLFPRVKNSESFGRVKVAIKEKARRKRADSSDDEGEKKEEEVMPATAVAEEV